MEDKCASLLSIIGSILTPSPQEKNRQVLAGQAIGEPLKFSSLSVRFSEKSHIVPSNLCRLIYCGILGMKSSFLFWRQAGLRLHMSSFSLSLSKAGTLLKLSLNYGKNQLLLLEPVSCLVFKLLWEMHYLINSHCTVDYAVPFSQVRFSNLFKGTQLEWDR